MAQQCICQLVGNFPALSSLGYTSITLRTNTPVIITSDNRMVLTGATTGELSVSAYGSMINSGNRNVFGCSGRAGASYDWIQKYDCLHSILYYIPSGGIKAYVEGDIGVGVTTDISMTEVLMYESVQAAASSGPSTVYMNNQHKDGYDFRYMGGPIRIIGRDIFVKDVGGNFLGADANYGPLGAVLPVNSEIYLMSFTWEQTPPSLSTVSYSFAFSGASSTLLTPPSTSVRCPDGTFIPV